MWKEWLQEKVRSERIKMVKNDSGRIHGSLNYIPIAGVNVGDIVDVFIYNEAGECIFEDYALLLFITIPKEYEYIKNQYITTIRGSQCVVVSKDWNQQFIALDASGIMSKKSFIGVVKNLLQILQPQPITPVTHLSQIQ